jgi:hypothetical protein
MKGNKDMLSDLNEFRKLVGWTHFLIVLLLAFIELIFNIPYLLLKLIFYPIWWFYDNFMEDNFYCINFINFSFFNKYVKYLETQIKEEQRDV